MHYYLKAIILIFHAIILSVHAVGNVLVAIERLNCRRKYWAMLKELYIDFNICGMIPLLLMDLQIL